MTTLRDTIEDTRQLLMSGTQDRLNVLQTSIDNAITSIQFTHELKGVVENARISIGLEEMHVLSVPGTAPGSSATVIRGYGGSPKLAHAAGDIIRVNPKFSDHRIKSEVNDELQGLSSPRSGLFQMKFVEFDYNPAVAGYNINATDLIDIWRVRYDMPGPTLEWPVLRRDEWYLDQHANTTDFPQGIQLVLRCPGFPGHAVRVSYKAKFSLVTNDTDDILAVSGLHDEAHRILPYGAAIGLTVGREVKRSFLTRQPEPRRSDEVPSGAAARATAILASNYTEFVQEEVERLLQRYPEQI